MFVLLAEIVECFTNYERFLANEMGRSRVLRIRHLIENFNGFGIGHRDQFRP